MSQDAREYAVEHGAPIMIYPPRMLNAPSGWHNVFPSGTIFKGEDGANKLKIAGFKEIFGRHRWPSNG